MVDVTLCGKSPQHPLEGHKFIILVERHTQIPRVIASSQDNVITTVQ